MGRYNVLTLFVMAFFAVNNASLNIFLDHQEVRRLLGLSAELYYVREGVINEYALNFVVPVPSHMQDIFFFWQALGERPVPYSIAIELVGGDPDSMDLPSLNISSKGNVPVRLQVFRLRFPCTGRVSSQVDVILHVNVTLPEHRKYNNVTQLRFKRKKICLQDEHRSLKNESVIQEPESLVTHPGTVYIAVGAACSLIFVLLATASLLYIRKRKAMIQETAYDVPAYCSNANVYLAGNATRGGSIGSASYATIASFQKVPLTPASSVFPSHRSVVAPGCHSNPPSTFGNTSKALLDLTTGHSVFQNKEVPAYQVSGLDFIHNSQQKFPNASPNFNGTDHVTNSPVVSNRTGKSYAHSVASSVSLASSYDPKLSDYGERLKRLAVPRFRITLRNLIQEGTFGRVYSGLFLHPTTSREGQVLIKTVAEHASASQKTVFLNEGTLMAGLQHRHILSVLGCCVDANNSPMIVYPWVSRGNLKRFLTSCRSGASNTEIKVAIGDVESRTTLMTQDVVDMAIQVVIAMLYLHRHRLIHKDLAARNCVVDERLRIKVTDPALARDLFPSDYHCLGDNENRPIKWMALESVTRREFSAASDVWSFGVLLWELTTLAQQPYVEVDPFEMETYLKDDYRLAQPLNCPDELFAVMACCWIADPKERPTFLQLLACLQDFHTALGRFI